ncbi:MAG: HAD family hydrolase [Silvanigrellales bacterium]|nr:HAD family hydrolase [Silvanigrellales bacterium]
MTDLRKYLVAQVERRLRERDAENRTLLRGQSAESGYDVGVRAALQALAEVFTRAETKADLFDVLAMEASRAFNAGPHPRSRTYRAEPVDWAIEDTQAKSVLALLEEHIASAKKAKTQPAVVFDLDGTLFDVSHRTLGILREWTASQADARRYPRALLRRVESIALCHMGYSLSHAFENAGLDLRDNDVSEILQSAEKLWRKRFFDGKTLVDLDRPVEGAKAFVDALHSQGVHICYLTGRDSRGMHQGTVRQLEVHGFPLEGCTLMLKAGHELEDHIYKQEAFAVFASKWSIVGNFENEYVNLGAMAPSAPQAVHVILDTQHSGRPVPTLPGKVWRLADFRLS